MKFRFLGTGTSQGIPVIGCGCAVCTSTDPKDIRFRTSAYIDWDDTHINIDVGPDFRLQMLNNNITKLDAIVLTHEHNDHISGLDDVRPFNYFMQESMKMYGEKRVLNELVSRFSYVFATSKYPGAPSVEQIEINANDTFCINNKKIIPIRVLHGSLPILGYRFGDLAYLTDVKTIPVTEFEKLKNLKVLVINALQEKSHHSHLTLEESLDLIKRIGAEKSYITHLSHKLLSHKDLVLRLPKNVYPAFDGLQIEI